jgi:hypothetical protein
MFNSFKQYIKNIWAQVPEKAKRHLHSAIVTFLSTFLLVLGAEINAQIATTDITTWTTAMLAAIFVVAARAGVKAVYELAIGWLPPSNPQ